VTHQGCTCKSDCGVTLTHDSARCDWCYTSDNCGETQLIGGSWDYCKYPPQNSFEGQSYTQKQAQLWSKITDASVVDQSGPTHYAATTLKMLLTTSMITPFEDQWEVLPAGRKKIIHTQGVNCQIEMSINSNSPFTGVLSQGTQSGLIRMGSATSLSEPLDGKIFPGFGIKFLRNGVRSADWVALRKTGPGGSYNYFESKFSTHVPPDPALTKLGRFQQASGCIDMVGLSDACTYTQEGNKASKPVFPFEIFFEPKVGFSDQTKSDADLMQELSGIRPGTELFEVRTFASPADAAKGNAVTIGTVKTVSTCHQSLFGDLNMFFRHQRMEEDFALRPDWIAGVKATGDSACDATTGPMAQWQCPFQGSQEVDV